MLLLNISRSTFIQVLRYTLNSFQLYSKYFQELISEKRFSEYPFERKINDYRTVNRSSVISTQMFKVLIILKDNSIENKSMNIIDRSTCASMGRF